MSRPKIKIMECHMIIVDGHVAWGQIDSDGMGWGLYHSRTQKSFTVVSKALCKANSRQLASAFKRRDKLGEKT